MIGLCKVGGCLSGSKGERRWQLLQASRQGIIPTSTSSSSTIDACLPYPGIDSSRLESVGSVAKINSLRVSSKGSTISNILDEKLKQLVAIKLDLPRIEGCLNRPRAEAYSSNGYKPF